MVDMESVSSVMADLVSVYQSRDDIEMIKSIQKNHLNLLDSCVSREEEIESMLQELEKSVAHSRNSASTGQSKEIHNLRVTALDIEKERSRSNIRRLEVDAKHLEEIRNSIQAEAKALKDKRRELEKAAREKMPRTVYELSLYANVTGIVWDHTEDKMAKGYIAKPKAGEVKVFDMDPTTSTGYDISNKLWELIG